MNFDQLVARTDLLGGLSPWSTRRITETQRVRSLPKRSMLFFEGDEGHAIYVLAGGSIRLFRSDEEGREAVVHLVRPGEVFAEAVLFDTGDPFPGPRTHGVRGERSLGAQRDPPQRSCLGGYRRVAGGQPEAVSSTWRTPV